jgi:hypothetical protein
MAQIFPKWTNLIPTVAAIVGGLFAVGAVAGVWYYFSPEYTDVGYRPEQPVPYSHKLHAGDLGIDCRYCHTTVETNAHANIPPTQTCMNCHKLVKPDSDKLALVRQSHETGRPIEWVRVHNLPDYAYFNHSVHINAGVGCISCHGNVAEMEIVQLTEPLSMGWCLDCHRNPEPHLRPVDQVTNMYWKEPENQAALAAQQMKDRNLQPREDCSACHR